ncbi:36122_t:CDS:1, partial [Gigaspora margarita]
GKGCWEEKVQEINNCQEKGRLLEEGKVVRRREGLLEKKRLLREVKIVERRKGC